MSAANRGKWVEGSKFNSLTLQSYLPKTGGHTMAVFLCDCGATKEIRVSRVISGDTKACGCKIGKALVESKLTHGKSKSREFHIWSNMLYRCRSISSKDYKYYGAKGVTVDPRWDTFEAFLSDMGEAPSESHTLDREDNLKGYSPENCRWATKTEQANNKSNTVFVVYKGETISRADLARREGMNLQTLRARLASGMSAEEAVTRPVRAGK